MASFFSSVRQGFGRQSNKNAAQQGRGNGQQTPSPTGYPNSQGAPSIPPMPHSPALSAATSVENAAPDQAPVNRKPPFFFRDEYAGLIVKGNFMTLAAKPVHVEEGEWLAHQVVEQYRLLDGMLSIIKTLDDRTGLPICNPDTCPTMSASGHTYTWLDNNKKPIKIPAYQYINLVQKWILGKITDPTLFPTYTSYTTPSAYPSGSGNSGMSTPTSTTPIPMGPTTLNQPLDKLAGRTWLGKSSGFPETFESDLKSIYRQMMRCYAHLYHGHWLDPFWHVNAYKELNTCFVHFVNVGKLYGLLGDKEMEPMMPLVELWVGKGLLPSQRDVVATQQVQQVAGIQGPGPVRDVPAAGGQGVSAGVGAAA